MTSTRFPNNHASVTTVLAYPSKSDAPIITTWKLTDTEAFERFCKDSSTQTTRHGVPYETCSRYVRWMHYTAS
jgi:hypothetical protein